MSFLLPLSVSLRCSLLSAALFAPFTSLSSPSSSSSSDPSSSTLLSSLVETFVGAFVGEMVFGIVTTLTVTAAGIVGWGTAEDRALVDVLGACLRVEGEAAIFTLVGGLGRNDYDWWSLLEIQMVVWWSTCSPISAGSSLQITNLTT